MKRLVQKIKSYSKSIELSEGDQDDLRARIVSFMQAHPMPASIPSATAIKSPYFSYFNIFKNPLALTAIFLLIASGGITSAAGGTLPGDLLYPVKIYVNESVEGVITFGTEAEAKLNAERVERRLEEIQILIAKGELDEERTAIAKAHLDIALKEAARLEYNRQEFDTALEAHATILAKLDRDRILEKVAVTQAITDARIALNKKEKAFIQNKEVTQGNVLNISTLESATDKMAIAKERIKRINEKLNSLDLEKETEVRVNTKIDKAMKIFAQGETSLAANDYQTAQAKFIDSMSLMQEAKLIAVVPKFIGIEDEKVDEAKGEIEVKKDDDKKDMKEDKDGKERDKNGNEDTSNESSENNDDHEDSSSNDPVNDIKDTINNLVN